MDINWIQLPGGLHLSLSGAPRTVAKDDPAYEAVLQALKEDASEEAIVMLLDADKLKLEQAIEVTDDIRIEAGIVHYQGLALDKVLSDRLIQMREEGFDLTPLVNFINNMMQNPSARVVSHLYKFLEVGKLALTKDGHFVAYKVINYNWTDCYTGKISNALGTEVTMPRNQVDENPDVTCSRGLHVCSWDYIGVFAGRSEYRVVECKVNPRDVVSIPKDYNHTKMRLCRYVVTRELTESWRAQNNVLAAAAVRNESSSDACFAVYREDMDGEVVKVDAVDRLAEAAEYLEDLAIELANSGYTRIWIQNQMTGIVVQEVTLDSSGSDDDDDDDDDDSDIEDTVTYQLRACSFQGDWSDLSDEYATVGDAIDEALNCLDEGTYKSIQILDSTHKLIRTLS